mmetsp:Transcript_20301/g.29733  ORF Transcript_20301/g.29733 Transcript_20301/m.29733 type:complete len:90 (-) Transcript_20301:763-1032(-)
MWGYGFDTGRGAQLSHVATFSNTFSTPFSTSVTSILSKASRHSSSPGRWSKVPIVFGCPIFGLRATIQSFGYDLCIKHPGAASCGAMER